MTNLFYLFLCDRFSFYFFFRFQKNFPWNFKREKTFNAFEIAKRKKINTWVNTHLALLILIALKKKTNHEYTHIYICHCLMWSIFVRYVFNMFFLSLNRDRFDRFSSNVRFEWRVPEIIWIYCGHESTRTFYQNKLSQKIIEYVMVIDREFNLLLIKSVRPWRKKNYRDNCVW